MSNFKSQFRSSLSMNEAANNMQLQIQTSPAYQTLEIEDKPTFAKVPRKIAGSYLRCYYLTLVFLCLAVFIAGTVKTIRMHGPRERNYTISHMENQTLEDIKQSVEAHKTPRVEMIFRARTNPYRLSEEEINYQFKSAKIPSLIKRIKRYACWHSCFGPFRKREIRTLYGHPIQLFQTDTDGKPALGTRKRSVKLDGIPTNNELGEGVPNTPEPSQSGTANEKTLEGNVTISLEESLEESDESQETTRPTGDANAKGSSTVHPKVADSREANVKIRTIVDETIEESEEIVPATKQVIKSTTPLSTVGSTKEASTGTVSPPGKKSGEKSTPTKDDPNGKQGQQEDEYSYEDSEEDSDDDTYESREDTANGKGDE